MSWGVSDQDGICPSLITGEVSLAPRGSRIEKVHGHTNMIKELVMMNPLLDRVNSQAITRVARISP